MIIVPIMGVVVANQVFMKLRKVKIKISLVEKTQFLVKPGRYSVKIDFETE
jgi:hypothetical protein